MIIASISKRGKGGPGMVRRTRRRGHAAVEMALMAPWIFILFAALLDIGIYCYAVIATENAARSAAMFLSQSSDYRSSNVTRDNFSRTIARRELVGMPNVSASTPWAATAGAISDANPFAADAEIVTRIATDDTVQVSVTYRTPQLFPLPGLMGRMTVTRIAEANVRAE